MSQEEAENRRIIEIQKENRRGLIWGIGLFLVLVLLCSGGTIFVLTDEDIYTPLRLSRTMELIRILYPESYNSGRMMTLAEDAVLNELDRYSGLLEPREMDRVTEEFTGSYGGIGITVVGHDRGLLIMSVREDGPAGRAGIRTGDVIIKADTTDLAGMLPYQSTYLLRGPEGTSINLKIARNKMADTLNVKLTREKLSLIHIPYAGMTDSGSLYIRIADFEAGTSADIKKTLDSLYFANPDRIKRIIIDLRGNPGGLLYEARQTADFFLNSGHLIVGIKGRSIWRHREYYSSGSDVTLNLPLAIIVDRGSASASEIVAGSLKYADRAILVGDTTFGKGLVQEYSGLGDGSGLRLTTSRYYFEGGIFLNNPGAEVVDSASGIAPDFYFHAEELNPFPSALENSMLMREFALDHQDEIIQYSPFTKSEPLWLDEFVDFVTNNGFKYKSNITGKTETTKELAELGNYSGRINRAIDRIYDISLKDDERQFNIYEDFIRRRLYQIALETKFGIARAYHDAIVPYRRDIQYAEALLMEEKRD